jgi:ubiquinone/menaquinone biosynthesis C-methylase UbiE
MQLANNDVFQEDQWGKTWGSLSEKQTYPELSFYKRAWHQILVSILENNIDFRDGQMLLECGCGNGIFSLELANKFPHLKLVLSDISSAALEYNKQLLAEFRRLKISDNFQRISPDYAIENMFNLEHSAETYDFVMNGGTLEHYNNDDILKLLNEMLRVLVPKGKLIIVVPNLLNFDINLYRIKLKIREITRKRLFGSMVLYGASDERNITQSKFMAIVRNISDISSVKYIKHDIAFPKFIPRTNNIVLNFIEKILVKFGFNWANIFIISKK